MVMAESLPAALERRELLHGGYVLFGRGFVPEPEASELYARLLTETPWAQGEISLFGRRVLEPRLTAWYGERDYTYAGRTLRRLPLGPLLQGLLGRLELACGARFNAVFLNRYRDGNDGMGLHADDEASLGRDPMIASLSLGQPRRFVLEPRGKQGASAETGRHTFELGHGDLLLMGGSTQHHYKHGVPKQRGLRGERINLTFRLIVAD